MATNEKVFKINGEEIVVDGDLHNTLNQLARRFYRLNGYEIPEDQPHDFFASKHPQENLMYTMALEAYHFHLSVGLE